MDEAHHQNSTWSLGGTLAQLRGKALRGQVDVAHPDRGLQLASLNGVEVGGPLFAIARESDEPSNGRWPLSAADVFVRGHDLVATYGPSDDWPFAPQIYWHADSLSAVDDVRASLSLLVSVQTHLLDTHPRLSVISKIRSSEQLYFSVTEGEEIEVRPAERDFTLRARGSLCCLLCRLADGQTSYVEIVPATDFREARIRTAQHGQTETVWQLFSDFLEKGVIRRARIFAAFVPQEKDVELAVECCTAIEQAPLPLTA